MTAGRAQLFILAHYPGPAWHVGVPFAEQPGIVDHIAFMRSLTERRLMVLGGPYAGSGEDGDPVGMAIIRPPTWLRQRPSPPRTHRSMLVSSAYAPGSGRLA